MVKIVKRSFKEIKPTDWVATKKNGRLIIHEVLFKGDNYLVSWGVNNPWTDGRIKSGQVLGIVKKKENWKRLHLVYLAEAKAILIEFENNRIKNLILKGPPCQIAKYGFLLDKPSADVDWLIDKDQFENVRRILNRRGYHLKRLSWVKKDNYLGLLPKVSEITFVKKIIGVKFVIDLHLQAVRSALTAWYKEPITLENMSRLTDYLLTKRAWSKGWPVLPDTENLFYLCLNLMFHHAGRGIYQLTNIAHLINRNKINWKKFAEFAKTYRVENYIYFPLLWTERLFKVKSSVLNDLRPSLWRLILAKLVINKFTIIRPLPASQWFESRLNLLSILYLRLVLSLGK